jgi:hypothetical protein
MGMSTAEMADEIQVDQIGNDFVIKVPAKVAADFLNNVDESN